MTQTLPIGPGTFVAIGGASGVGKDTLIRYARERLCKDPRFLFVRRTITRAPDNASEDHLSVNDAEFQRLAERGAFALSWAAHGLRYGLPTEIDDRIAGGHVVIANVSRTILPELEGRYARVVAVAVNADPAIVRDRLIKRDREDAEAIRKRSERVVAKSDGEWIDLHNSGPVAEAGEVLVGILSVAVGRR